MPLAFINYRRSDASLAAQALYAQLQARLGPSSIFLDVSSIQSGEIWPDRIKNSLSDASVLLVIIGPTWLSASNEFYQRKIDDPQDWVRVEIEHALNEQKPIIPIFVDGTKVCHPIALPISIRNILNNQSIELRHEKWESDFSDLISVLVKKHKFTDNYMKVAYPSPEVSLDPLTTIELNSILQTLPGWLPVESLDPQNYPNSRQELRKLYQFKTFKTAINFMQLAVPKINKLKHHPRWENQWKSVTIYLSTWDIGNQISDLDIQLAKELDLLYEEIKTLR